MVTRVLVVDDSSLFRSLLRAILKTDPSMQLVGEARNGHEAVELASKLKPDVITMDVHMPMLDGIEAIRRIMETDPKPIVVVSGDVDPKDVRQAFGAIEAGAVAVVAKPPSPTDPDYRARSRELLTTLRLMAEVRVVSRRGKSALQPAAEFRVKVPGDKIGLVAIAASTGGPSALETILRDLPADLPVPVVIVQHIAPGFEQGLVDWLQRTSPLDVSLASDNRPLRAGEVLVSVADSHLVLSRRAVRLDGGPLVDGHRPSASVLFSSVADTWGSKALGIVLTGMGKDGARGLVKLKEAGGRVIAQDAATSIVDGMPGSARAAGIVDHVLPLPSIARAIARICGAE